MENIMLIVAKDDFLIKERVSKILNSIGKNIDDVEVFDIDDGQIPLLLSEITCISMFGDQRFFWVKNPSSLTRKGTLDDESLQNLAKYIKSPLESSFLIFTSNDYYENGELSKILKKHVLVEDLDVLEQTNDLYIKRFLDEHFISMTKEAQNELSARVNDFQTLQNELLKLFFYAEGREIDLKMVDLLVCKSSDKKIYELTNALISGNKETMLSIFQDLLFNNEEPIRIMNNMLGKLNELLYTKKMLEQKQSKEEIAQYFNVSLGRAYYMIKGANEVSLKTITKYLEGIKELDYNIKSGNIDKTIGLELFLLKA